MAGYVPFNTPIIAGLLMKNPSMPQVLFWQWLNQTHNACVNYANRNATKVIAELIEILNSYNHLRLCSFK